LAQARKAYESQGAPTYEADIAPGARFLMERFIKGGVAFEDEPTHTRDGYLHFVDPSVKPSDFTPDLNLLSIDIECSLGMDLYSIALHGNGLERVLMLDRDCQSGLSKDDYQAFQTEKELLNAFFQCVREYDPDVLIGWNVVGFDLRWLWRKCISLGIALDIGTDGPAEMLEPGKLFNQWMARIPGRAVLDGIQMARMAFVRTEDYALATVAREILGRKKLIETSGREKAAEIARLFASDKGSLARYNLEDTRLVSEIFAKLNLAQLAVRRSQLTGLTLDRAGGSAAAFDFLYLPLLHRHGYVADTYPPPPNGAQAAPGGLVLDSVPGFYHNVGVFDFKSLYPSIIRTFRVDPLAANVVLHHLIHDIQEQKTSGSGRLIRGPAGLEFADDFAILPTIIAELWEEREKAKRAKDRALSQAVKIIMNSFYGVLGSRGCRFFDPRIAGSITRTGHWILTFSRTFIEERGYRVIYGDTDSLFVQLGEEAQRVIRETGSHLAADLNGHLASELKRRFDVESHLDIEFETVFVRFFRPTIRGAEIGSKKRYVGQSSEEGGAMELHFVGMESSRRDWTALAKEFQADLFEMLFQMDGAPSLRETLTALIRERHEQLLAGNLDEKLVYRKGLSKPLQEYTKNVPPHVRAARMLDHLEGRIVRYVMTTAGPEPIQKRTGAPFDYAHYSQKQLAPVADMVLRIFDMDYGSVLKDERQLDLF
jgi:DNA polymerase-2